jgi:hypothetical protein
LSTTTTTTITKDDRQDLWNIYISGGDEVIKEMQDNGEIHDKLEFLRTIKENLMAVGTAESQMASEILLRFIKARGEDAIQFFHLRTLNSRIEFRYWTQILSIAQDLDVYKSRTAHKDFSNLCRGTVVRENDGVYESVIQESWVKQSYLPTFRRNVQNVISDNTNQLELPEAEQDIEHDQQSLDNERVLVLTAISEFEDQIAKLSDDLSCLRDRLLAIYRHSIENKDA